MRSIFLVNGDTVSNILCFDHSLLKVIEISQLQCCIKMTKNGTKLLNKGIQLKHIVMRSICLVTRDIVWYVLSICEGN